MIKKFFTKVLDVNQKQIDKMAKTVDEVNSFEKKIKKLNQQDFSKYTSKYIKHLSSGGSFDEILPEAFALAREASWRELGMRPYDVQILASIALFNGKVIEQKTGEGKTLAAVPALYLRSLSDKGSHLVTVNDYLAKRDAGWNAPIFSLLGRSVGAIAQEMKSYIYDPEYVDSSHGDERLSHLKPVERKLSYAADITYGTNNEFGFDYLRDNMVQSLDQMVQRGHYFVIVDEVDSVLIDEARTPLIISAPDMEPTKKYYEFAKLIENLNPDVDFTIDEKSKSANLTERGIKRVEKIMNVDNLYEKDWDAIHHIENALRAKTLYLKDRDYVVKDNSVTIVDEFTGRLMVGRRWSDGLHQAVEAKEGVTIQQESKTLATISFQNYFRMYEVLSGMTGTAATEAEEFGKIYNLDVNVIPTNKPMIRDDQADLIYKNIPAKYSAIVKDISKTSSENRPILVGTTSIEKNEIISSLLKKKRIPHNVLNAKNHEKEALIIADAGKPGAVTVATNMAGRGVDIVLGGSKPDRPDGVDQEKYENSQAYKNWKKQHDLVIKSGGLHVIGTERHESRRIDNQLRGRSGRQGDPGSSRFYLSLEDDLMRIFGGEQIKGLMDRLNLPDDQPIENKLVSRAIEQSQVKVEGFHFDIRKNLVEYDDVANQQREIVYKLRKRILESSDLKTEILEKLFQQVDRIYLLATGVETQNLDTEKVVLGMLEMIPFDEKTKQSLKTRLEKLGNDEEKVKQLLRKLIEDVHASRETQVGDKVMRQVEKFAYLGSIDHLWIDHIDHIDGLREGVRLRGYAQKDPVAEFKNEAFGLFEGLIDRIDEELARRIFRIGVTQMPQPEIPLEQARTNVDQLDSTGLVPANEELTAKAGAPAFSSQASTSTNTSSSKDNKKAAKTGRNDPCWCGSGKKFKKCHYPQLG